MIILLTKRDATVTLGGQDSSDSMSKYTESMVLNLYLKPGEKFKSLKSDVY